MHNISDAFFAGRIFAPGEQDGFRFFLWGESNLPLGQEAGIATASTFAEPADGAFLCKMQTGWLFVAGVIEQSNFRHTFFDGSNEAAENALAMQELGIPIVAIEEANQRVKSDGVPLYSVTEDEKRRADALARQAK